MKDMFYGMPNSPVTTLSDNITDTQTVIPIKQTAKLPPAPNIATIGFGSVRETIIYNTKTSNTLEGVTRGIEGTRKEWVKGTEIARYYTSYEHNNMIDNINLLNINTNTALKKIGSIIQSGSNNNGFFIKFADGTMICYLVPKTISDITTKPRTENGFSHFFCDIDWNYPLVFINRPNAFAKGQVRGNNNYSTRIASNFNTHATYKDHAKFRVWSVADLDTVINFVAYAIGRWK